MSVCFTTAKDLKLQLVNARNRVNLTLQTYGLSVMCTFECFFLSELLANRRSHPLNSHLNGFSP